MGFRIRCSYCGEWFSSNKKVGRKVKCKFCGKFFIRLPDYKYANM